MESYQNRLGFPFGTLFRIIGNSLHQIMSSLSNAIEFLQPSAGKSRLIIYTSVAVFLIHSATQKSFFAVVTHCPIKAPYPIIGAVFLKQVAIFIIHWNGDHSHTGLYLQ